MFRKVAHEENYRIFLFFLHKTHSLPFLVKMSIYHYDTPEKAKVLYLFVLFAFVFFSFNLKYLVIIPRQFAEYTYIFTKETKNILIFKYFNIWHMHFKIDTTRTSLEVYKKIINQTHNV